MREGNRSGAWQSLYEFSWGLEPFVLAGSVGASLYGFWRFWPLSFHRLFGLGPNPGLGLVRATVLLSAPWFAYVLINDAASDIVGFYVWFYVFFAYACLMIGTFARPVLGLLHVADIVERQNLAAGVVMSGFAVGTAFAFGGALTGEGPSWIVVWIFFLLAYLELRAALALVSRISGGLAGAVRHDRDMSAAVLLAGVAIGAGLIAGRAAAGDFLGWRHAMGDYGDRIWPIIAVPVAASLAGFLTQEHAKRLQWRGGVAVVLILFGAYFYFVT